MLLENIILNIFSFFDSKISLFFMFLKLKIIIFNL